MDGSESHMLFCPFALSVPLSIQMWAFVQTADSDLEHFGFKPQFWSLSVQPGICSSGPLTLGASYEQRRISTISDNATLSLLNAGKILGPHQLSKPSSQESLPSCLRIHGGSARKEGEVSLARYGDPGVAEWFRTLYW